MSIIKVINLQHPTASTANITLSNTGGIALNGSVSGGGMDLITPTSVVGSGVTLSGGQVSFSSSTTLSVNGCFTSAYDNYLIEINIDTASAGNYLDFRMRASGSDVSSATYASQQLTAGATSVGAARITASTSGRVMYTGPSTSSSALINFFNPFRATATTLFGRANEEIAAPFMWNIIATNSNATSYDGFSLINATANITGKLRIYGLRTS